MNIDTILLIEDDRDFSTLLGDFLGQHGYKCEYAYSYEEAISQLTKQRYMLIISDIRLGDERDFDGLKILEWLSVHDSNTYVILLSAFITPQISEQAFSTYKPISLLDKAEGIISLLSQLKSIIAQ
jgi:DNA-binding response OmpR family regulator